MFTVISGDRITHSQGLGSLCLLKVFTWPPYWLYLSHTKLPNERSHGLSVNKRIASHNGMSLIYL